MELCKKTTILFPHELHDRLVRLARDRETSRVARGEVGAAIDAEAVASLHAADAICSYDRDFDRTEGIRRIEPPA